MHPHQTDDPLWAQTADSPHVFREIMRAHQAIIQHFSQEVGMPAARLGLMRVLALAHPQGVGSMAVARRLGVNAAAVTRQANALEEEGLVTRQATSRDKRFRRLTLTEAGLRAFRDLHAKSHALEDELRADLGDEVLERTARVLVRIRETLESKGREELEHVP